MSENVFFFQFSFSKPGTGGKSNFGFFALGGGCVNTNFGAGGGSTLELTVETSSFSLFEVSSNISSAFLIKSSSVNELKTLVVLSGSRLTGGGVVLMRRLDFVGIFKGIVLIGGSAGFKAGRDPIFGSIKGIVRSAVFATPEVEGMSLVDP